MSANRRRPTRRDIEVLLLGIVVLAWALRLYRLSYQSLSYDESVSVYLANLPIGEMLRWTAADVQPPLYYLLLKGWVALAGTSEFSLRLLSAFFSLVAVPLFYRLGHRFGGAGVAIAAALAAAIHPWYVWQAQDARMYSLLLLAGIAATLALLRWTQDSAGAKAPPATLALLYAALLYTHYLAAGLILAHTLVVAWGSWRAGGGRPLARYLLRAIAPAFALFAPWLPAVLRTMQGDTSYWAGSLKLDEALRKALVALFVGAPGETVLESPGFLVAGIMAALLVLVLLVQHRRGTIWILAVSLVTLAATLAAFLLVPKFNPRYLILASIALPVLWGQAVAALGTGALGPGRRLSQALGAATLLVVVGGSAFGLGGMYWDIRLTRADFRSAIGQVLAQATDEEVPVLVSGHMYPVWHYYAPGRSYLALPNKRVLDVDAALDLGVADELRAGLEGAAGAWLLLWQDEVADPMGAVAFLLDQAAPAEETDFWHVRVRHYRFGESTPRIEAVVEPNEPLCRFEGGVSYLGSVPDDAGNLILLWRAETDLAIDLRAQVTISDDDGHEIMRIHLSPGGDRYPTSLWAPHQLAFVRLNPATPPAVAAGTYPAALTLYQADSGAALNVLDAAGNPSGQVCRLGSIELQGNTVGVDPVEAAAFHGLRVADDPPAWPGARIVAFGECPAPALPPGSDLTIPLLVEIGPETVEAGASIQATLVSPSGEGSLGKVRLPPGGDDGIASLALVWLDGRIAADADAGVALVRLSHAGTGEAPTDLALCTLRVADVSRNYGQVSPGYPMEALIAESVDFLGLDAPAEPVSRGDRIGVNLYFRALETPLRNYAVFLHLLGPDGALVAQANGAPAGRPTAGWLPGELVTVKMDLIVPTGSPSGDYTFEVGWFRPEVEGLPRASVTIGGRAAESNSAHLGQLVIR